MSDGTDDPLRDPGWLSRLASTGRLAGAAARLGARRLLGREEGEPDERLGEALADELDHMKGMAMKLGQVLSYFEGVLPGGTHQALQRLQLGVTAMGPERVAAAVEADLGAPPADLFERFDEEPVASASIGQVHRARHAGREVAVKVQYPGVADTVESDVARLRAVARIASLGSAVDGLAVVEELRERFAEECSYVREAEAQRAFRRAFADDPGVAIPGVVEARSGETVLTTEWMEGRSFYAFARGAPAAERAAAARVLLRFAHRSFWSLGAINADPHPGNYLFPEPAPPVGFLDFGCVRRFDRAFVEEERRIARAILDGDRRGFRAAVLEADRVAREAGFDWPSYWRLARHQYAPYLRGRFRFDLAYVRRGMELAGPGNPSLRRLRVPPAWIWLQRLHWGLHAVLARLEVEGDFATLFREILDRDPEPDPFTAVPES